MPENIISIFLIYYFILIYLKDVSYFIYVDISYNFFILNIFIGYHILLIEYIYILSFHIIFMIFF